MPIAFDIELNSHDPQEIIKAVLMLNPTFGGINRQAFKAPKCFALLQRKYLVMKDRTGRYVWEKFLR
jgi:malate dehydrogenase (oxaloacetate-decarboxylating)(NADP+)